MAQSSRSERLVADLESLNELKKTSTIFDFETSGDPPDRFTVTFRGKGVARDSSADSDVEIVELHKCEIRLPYSYPDRGPDIRWASSLFHPNVSFSGFINLKQIGLPWEKDITLDVVVERLWDVARCAFMNLKKATNYSAKNWYEDECTLRLPIDPRPLRDKSAPSLSNVIQYERKADSSVDLPTSRRDTDVFYIGNDTPLPDMPASDEVSQNDDDDILYIG